MNIFVDIQYSFIREPIKLALVNELGYAITFVNSEEDAGLVIGSSDTTYSKPCIILTDDPYQLIVQDNALDIAPFPSSADELTTLVKKVGRLLKVLP